MGSVSIQLLDLAYEFFFFQAEDGIRDLYVTGVQTCALPISSSFRPQRTLPSALAYSIASRIAAKTSSPIEIGRASCRERVWISVVAAALTKTKFLRVVQIVPS